jgi:hypothetical protein
VLEGEGIDPSDVPATELTKLYTQVEYIGASNGLQVTLREGLLDGANELRVKIYESRMFGDYTEARMGRDFLIDPRMFLTDL